MKGLYAVNLYLDSLWPLLCDYWSIAAIAQLDAIRIQYVLISLVVMPLGGIFFRIRGGLWAKQIERYIPNYGATKSRALCALLYTLVCAAVAWDAYLILIWPFIYLGLPMGWFHAADIGRDRDRPRLIEFALMTLRGILLTLPGGVVFVLMGYGWLYLLSGVFLGVAYEMGHRTNSQIQSFRQGMEVGEFYTGCLLMVAAVLSVRAYDPATQKVISDIVHLALQSFGV